MGLVSSSEPHHTPLHRTGASRDEGERQPRWRVELIPLSFTPPTVASAEGDERRWVGFGLSSFTSPHSAPLREWNERSGRSGGVEFIKDSYHPLLHPTARPRLRLIRSFGNDYMIW